MTELSSMAEGENEAADCSDPTVVAQVSYMDYNLTRWP